jgi:predicted transcriptional regulator
MTPGVIFCFENQAEAARLMKEKEIRRLLVLNRDRRLVGVVALANVAVKIGDEQVTAETVERVSEPAQPNR